MFSNSTFLGSTPRSAEAKAQAKASAGVMTALERQLLAAITKEREERCKDVEDLRARLDEVCRGMQERAVHGTAAQHAAAPLSGRQGQPVHSPADQHATVLSPASSVKDAPEGHRRIPLVEDLSQERAVLGQLLEALKASIKKAQIEMQKAMAARGTSDEMEAERLTSRSTRSSTVMGAPALEGLTDELATLHARLDLICLENTQGAAALPKAASPGPRLGEEEGAPREPEQTSGIEDVRTQVASLGDEVQKLAKDLHCFRRVLVQLCTNVPLQAVRTTRTALRSNELSKEERQQTMQVLDTKEKQLLTEIAQLGRRSSEAKLFGDFGVASLEVNGGGSPDSVRESHFGTGTV
mmetsp:Transcript_62363/g.182197  ORF Transcript_62363/g.182197 Transcript_62363/m.182197 type:complete len:353 (+) Transcript_62363:106-1164(+)